MTDLVSLTQQLAAAASLRVGLKVTLAAPKIEALLRAMPEEAREGYARRALADDGAFQVFVEALLVHETYFFRHAEQLRVLQTDVLPRLLRARALAGRSELTVWCAGCSTGEEAYTVALLVQAAAARAPEICDLSVLGTDLSANALASARRGEYALLPGLNSFRDLPDFARHHFARVVAGTADTWSPSADVRRITQFVRHNVVTDPAPGTFDLILCRNTLIYFDDPGLRRALGTIESSLRPGGALFLGPAETPREDSRLTMRCADHAIYWTKPDGGAP